MKRKEEKRKEEERKKIKKRPYHFRVTFLNLSDGVCTYIRACVYACVCLCVYASVNC